MPPGSIGRPSNEHDRGVIAASFVLAAAVRIALALAFPTIYGGDTVARLAHADTLVLAYQLPLPQIFVMLGKAMNDDPVIVRLIFCVFGATLAAGMTALLTLGLDSRVAMFGVLLFAFDPLLIHYSIVPYQESIAYGLIAWAFAFAVAERHSLGTLAMGAACLCRYEAWLFLPVFIAVSGARRVALLAVLPVLGWISWWGGLAPAGFYVLDIDMAAGRLPRVSYLASKLLEYESVFLPALAALGLFLAIRTRARAPLLFGATIAYITAVVIGLGDEYPPGTGRMSERLIHLPVLLCLGFAAMALGRFSEWSRATLVVSLTLGLVFAARNLRFETRLLRATAQDQDLALAREAARVIESNRAPGECVSVSAPVVDPALLEAYVSKVGASFGDVARARTRAADISDTAPDRDRIAAHLRAPTGTVRGAAECPLLMIVDDEAEPPPRAILAAELSAGRRRARLWRIPR